jgi:hypothetical protein
MHRDALSHDPLSEDTGVLLTSKTSPICTALLVAAVGESLCFRIPTALFVIRINPESSVVEQPPYQDCQLLVTPYLPS